MFEVINHLKHALSQFKQRPIRDCLYYSRFTLKSRQCDWYKFSSRAAKTEAT